MAHGPRGLTQAEWDRLVSHPVYPKRNREANFMAKTFKKRYEYKVTLGKDLQGEPIRKSFYSTKSLADAKKKGERYRLDYEMELCVSGSSCIKAVSFAVWAKSCLETYKKPYVKGNTYSGTYWEPVQRTSGAALGGY